MFLGFVSVGLRMFCIVFIVMVMKCEVGFLVFWVG